MPRTSPDGLYILDDNDIIIGYADDPAPAAGTIVRKPPKPEEPKDPYRFQANDGSLYEVVNGVATKVFQDTPAPKAGEGPEKPKTPEAMAELQADIIKNIKLAQDLKRSSQEDMFATGLGNVPLRYISGTPAFDASTNVLTLQGMGALDKIVEMKQQAGGANPLGVLSNSDLELIKATVASLDPGQSDDRFQKNLDVVIEKMGRVLTPEQRASLNLGPEAQAANTANVQAALAAPGSAKEGRAVPPDLQSEVMGYVRSRPTDQLDSQDFAAFLNDAFKRYDYPARVTPEEAAATVEGIRAGGTYGGVNPLMEKASGVSSMLNSAAQSAPGAFFINTADALTAGNLDSMTSDPAFTRGGMQAVSDENPIAAPLGQVAGVIGGTLGAGKALGALSSLPAAFRGTAAADTLYGAAYGAGNNDEDRLTGALVGGGLGLAGNRVGNAIANRVTGAMRGVTDPDVTALAAAGVPMTYGQMRGGAAKASEERLMSNPFIGDAIRARQIEGMEGFNRAAFNEAGDRLGTTIPQIGQQGAEQARLAADALYDTAHMGMRWQPDPTSGLAFGAAQRRQAANGVLKPEELEQVSKNIASNVGGRMRNGELSGESFKTAMSQMRSDARSMAPAVGSAVKEYRDIILNAAKAQSAPDAVEALTKADAAYPYVKVLQQAVGMARNQGDNLITPAQLGNAAYTQTKRFGGDAAAAEGRVPFNDLQQAAVKVLPNRVPNSGTAEREINRSLWGNVVPRATAAVRSPLYSPQAQAIIQALMLDRPAALRAAGQNPVVRGALGANVGAPLAITYYGGN